MDSKAYFAQQFIDCVKNKDDIDNTKDIKTKLNKIISFENIIANYKSKTNCGANREIQNKWDSFVKKVELLNIDDKYYDKLPNMKNTKALSERYLFDNFDKIDKDIFYCKLYLKYDRYISAQKTKIKKINQTEEKIDDIGSPKEAFEILKNAKTVNTINAIRKQILSLDIVKQSCNSISKAKALYKNVNVSTGQFNNKIELITNGNFPDDIKYIALLAYSLSLVEKLN